MFQPTQLQPFNSVLLKTIHASLILFKAMGIIQEGMILRWFTRYLLLPEEPIIFFGEN